MQDYVVDMLENDQKFLIFAHHKCLLNGIEAAVRTKFRFALLIRSGSAHVLMSMRNALLRWQSGLFNVQACS